MREVTSYTPSRAEVQAWNAAAQADTAPGLQARRAAARARAHALWDETPEDAAWYAEQAILTHEECRVRAIGPTHLDRRAGKRRALVFGNKIKTGKYVRIDGRRIPVLQQVRKSPHVKRT